MRGVEVKEGSGEQGFFQVRIVRTAPQEPRSFDTTIGLAALLATLDVDLSCSLGFGRGCFRCQWSQSGGYCSTLLGMDYIMGGFARRFGTGDVVGIMVDCIEVPTLRFFLNGVQVHRVVVAQEGYGQVLFPVFSLWNSGQIHIASNPDFPSGEEEGSEGGGRTSCCS